MRRNTAIMSFLLATSLGAAQVQFTEYVGEIKTGLGPTTLAVDPQGRLYYGTFNQTGSIFSHVRMIDDPVAAIGSPNEAGTTVVLMTGTGKINASGRGVQSMDIASDNTLFVGGDSTASTGNNIWKFDYTAGDPPTFTEDTTFTANVKLDQPRRRSGISIVSESGNGLLITCGFGTTSFIDYFNFAGNVVGSPITDELYQRDIMYLPPYNVAYPMRNGRSDPSIIRSYVSGINTVTGGGTLVPEVLVPDGGVANTTGHAIQGGYYYAAQNQFMTLDAHTTEDPMPQLRVFNILDNGTSLSLAYALDGTSPETTFPRIYDAAVVANHLFICGYDQVNPYETSKIYVFREPAATVRSWNEY